MPELNGGPRNLGDKTGLGPGSYVQNSDTDPAPPTGLYDATQQYRILISWDGATTGGGAGGGSYRVERIIEDPLGAAADRLLGGAPIDTFSNKAGSNGVTGFWCATNGTQTCYWQIDNIRFGTGAIPDPFEFDGPQPTATPAPTAVNEWLYYDRD